MCVCGAFFVLFVICICFAFVACVVRLRCMCAAYSLRVFRIIVLRVFCVFVSCALSLWNFFLHVCFAAAQFFFGGSSNR